MQSENATEEPSSLPWFIGGFIASTVLGIAAAFYAPLDGSNWGVEAFVWLTVALGVFGGSFLYLPPPREGPNHSPPGERLMAILLGAFIGVFAAGIITALWQTVWGLFQ
jgi:hypothetical protein